MHWPAAALCRWGQLTGLYKHKRVYAEKNNRDWYRRRRRLCVEISVCRSDQVWAQSLRLFWLLPFPAGCCHGFHQLMNTDWKSIDISSLFDDMFCMYVHLCVHLFHAVIYCGLHQDLHIWSGQSTTVYACSLMVSQEVAYESISTFQGGSLQCRGKWLEIDLGWLNLGAKGSCFVQACTFLEHWPACTESSLWAQLRPWLNSLFPSHNVLSCVCSGHTCDYVTCNQLKSALCVSERVAQDFLSVCTPVNQPPLKCSGTFCAPLLQDRTSPTRPHLYRGQSLWLIITYQSHVMHLCNKTTTLYGPVPEPPHSELHHTWSTCVTRQVPQPPPP